MFNISTLKTALTGYIGVRQFDDTTLGSISTALRSSVSGQYFDDFHPFLRTDNLYYSAPEDATFNTWIQNKIDGSVAKLFNRLATDKKLNGSTKSIFDNLQIFTGAGLLSDTITKSSRLVGLAIGVCYFSVSDVRRQRAAFVGRSAGGYEEHTVQPQLAPDVFGHKYVSHIGSGVGCILPSCFSTKAET